MKKHLAPFLAFLVLASCKKEEDLGPTEPYQVKVTDAWTGTPIPEASVSLLHNRCDHYYCPWVLESTNETDKNGALSFERRHAGKFLNATSSGYEAYSPLDSNIVAQGSTDTHFFTIRGQSTDPIILDLPTKCWVRTNLVDVGEQYDYNVNIGINSEERKRKLRFADHTSSLVEDGTVIGAIAREANNTLVFTVHDHQLATFPKYYVDVELIKNDTVDVFLEY